MDIDIERLYELLDDVCDKLGEDSDEYVGVADEVGQAVNDLRRAETNLRELLNTK